MCDNTVTGSHRQRERPGAGRLPTEQNRSYVGSHVEVYTGSGVFLFSADTVREAMEELAE